MKKINFILFIISIIGVIFAFSLFSKEGNFIKVNSKNKEIVVEALKDEIDNTDNITMVILGNGWNSGKLTIYHSLGKTETLYISEGMFELGDLEKYIRENGYNLDNTALILLGISIFILMYLSVYKVANTKKVRIKSNEQ